MWTSCFYFFTSSSCSFLSGWGGGGWEPRSDGVGRIGGGRWNTQGGEPEEIGKFCFCNIVQLFQKAYRGRNHYGWKGAETGSAWYRALTPPLPPPLVAVSLCFFIYKQSWSSLSGLSYDIVTLFKTKTKPDFQYIWHFVVGLKTKKNIIIFIQALYFWQKFRILSSNLVKSLVQCSE